jgi:hypothetical protein
MNHHTYTQQFFDLNFEPYRNLVENISITNQLHTTRVPICPVDLDRDILQKIYKYLCSIDHAFTANPHHSHNKHDWADPLRSHNWQQLVIRQKPALYKLRAPTSSSTFEISNDSFGDVHLEQLLDQLLAPLNVYFHTIKIAKLDKRGWVAPHMDATANDLGLCYSWIPLHEFSPCLKLFPWGWLQHEFGKMYLFNHSRYVHAVYNPVDKPRLVIQGIFAPEKVSSGLLEQYSRSKETFRDLFAD